MINRYVISQVKKDYDVIYVKSGEFIGIFRFQHNKIGEKFDVITQCGTCGNLVSKDSLYYL